MPVKPPDTPEPWANAGNYAPSNYSATFPWGDPHPQAGLPTPWSGQPRLETAGLAGFCSQGAVPLTAQAADLWNEEYRRVVELTIWVAQGTSAPVTDTRIVESDSLGSILAPQIRGGQTGFPTLGTGVMGIGLAPNGNGVQASGVGTGVGLFATCDPGGSGCAIEAECSNGNAAILANGTGGNSGGLRAVGDGSGPAVRAEGTTGAPTIHSVADAASTDVAIQGTGGSGNASSHGVFGLAGHAGSFGVFGQSAVSATEFVGRGVFGSGIGQGAGVWAASEDSYALYVVGDTTSPRRAAMRTVPQDDDPSQPLTGDFYYSSARKVHRVTRETIPQSVHTSPLGWLSQMGSTEAGSTAGGSGALSLISVTPESLGRVRLEATATLLFSVDNGLGTIAIVDDTAAVTVATAVISAKDRDGIANNVSNISVRANYSLPSAAAGRAFSIVITATTGLITWSNTILTCDGLYPL